MLNVENLNKAASDGARGPRLDSIPFRPGRPRYVSVSKEIEFLSCSIRYDVDDDAAYSFPLDRVRGKAA